MLVSEKNTLLASKQMNSVTRSLVYIWLAMLLGVALSASSCQVASKPTTVMLFGHRNVDFAGRVAPLITSQRAGIWLMGSWERSSLAANKQVASEQVISGLVTNYQVDRDVTSWSVTDRSVTGWHHRCETCGWRR